MKAPVIAAFGMTLALFSTPAWVHHSYATFDTTKHVSVTGTVTEFNWTNPHASFKVSTLNAVGGTEVWSVEMGSPNNLILEGWRRTSLKLGDKVTVTMSPLRDGRRGGSYVGIILANGKALGKPLPP
jgi:Family of unknown function (DUF6152)